MSKNKEMATPGQIAQFGLLVSQQVVAKMGEKDFSKKELQVLLTPPHNGKVKEIVDSVVSQVFEIKTNIWARQIEKLTKFWKENFNHDIQWHKLKLPEEKESFGVLEYVPDFFTEDHVYNKYAEIFGKDNVYKHYDNIRNSIETQQARPTGPYLFLHRGGQEPDADHLNKSYDIFYQDGKKYMIPLEGMISALRYRVETGKMMDVKGLTRFHALDSDGNAMCMYGNSNGGFGIGGDDRSNQNGYCGPREISF